MSVPRGFSQNGKSLYMNITKPMEVELNFTVDSTNGNGLGVRSIKSNGYVANVFMNTSAAFTGTRSVAAGTLVSAISGGTSSLRVGMAIQGASIPAGTTIVSIASSSSIVMSAAATGTSSASITYQGVGLDSQVNPNPAAGYCLVQFKNNFNYVLSGSNSIVSPVSGTPILVTTGVTAGLAYIIVSLGTTSLAQWQKLGVPAGLTPSVGMSFIAPATTTATGTGAIEVPSVSGITSIETVGDPNQSSNNSNIAANGGAWVLLQFLGATSSSVTTLIPTAPAAGSVISMRFRFDGSSVSIPDGGPSNSSTSGGL